MRRGMGVSMQGKGGKTRALHTTYGASEERHSHCTWHMRWGREDSITVDEMSDGRLAHCTQHMSWWQEDMGFALPSLRARKGRHRHYKQHTKHRMEDKATTNSKRRRGGNTEQCHMKKWHSRSIQSEGGERSLTFTQEREGVRQLAEPEMLFDLHTQPQIQIIWNFFGFTFENKTSSNINSQANVINLCRVQLNFCYCLYYFSVLYICFNYFTNLFFHFLIFQICLQWLFRDPKVRQWDDFYLCCCKEAEGPTPYKCNGLPFPLFIFIMLIKVIYLLRVYYFFLIGVLSIVYEVKVLKRSEETKIPWRTVPHHLYSLGTTTAQSNSFLFTHLYMYEVAK